MTLLCAIIGLFDSLFMVGQHMEWNRKRGIDSTKVFTFLEGGSKGDVEKLGNIMW